MMLNNRELATLEVLHDRVQTAIDEYHDFTTRSLPKRKLDKLDADVALRMICEWKNMKAIGAIWKKKE